MNKYVERGAYHARWYKDQEIDWYTQSVNMIVDFCNGTTLDLGCAEGVVTSLVTNKGYDVTGVDSDPIAIEMAKYLVPNARFLLKDITKPTKGKWDFLASLNGIEYADDPTFVTSLFEKHINKGAIVIVNRTKMSQYRLKSLFTGYKTKEFEINDTFIGIMAAKTAPNQS